MRVIHKIRLILPKSSIVNSSFNCQLKKLFTIALFLRESKMMHPFLFHNTVSMSSFAGNHTQKFSFDVESVCFHFMDCLFNTCLKGQTHVCYICKHYFFCSNMLLRIYHTFFSKFHMIQISQSSKI